METWGMDYNGGPYHKGICPECDGFNGDCTDGICDKCAEEELSQIPDDLEPVTDEDADEFTTNFLNITK